MSTYDESWQGFSPPQVGATYVLSGAGGGWLGPYIAAPVKESTSTIWMDFKCPRGIGQYNNDGDLVPHFVEIELQYRAVGASSWNSVTYRYEDATTDQLGFTERIDFGTPILPEVKVRRKLRESDDQKVLDKIEWVRLKSKLSAAVSYTDVTTMAVAIRGTNAIGASAENKINTTLQRLLPTAADYIAGNVNNRAAQSTAIPFFIHATQDAGYPLSSLDLPHLAALDTQAMQRGDTFNAEFGEETTLYDVQKRALATLYAEPVIDYGKISAVREQVTSDLGHLYTPNVIAAPGVQRSVNFYDADEHDGVLVEYFDIETNKPATVECRLAIANDQFIKPQKVRAFGITDRTRAWRYGMRIRRKAFYKPTQYRFKTEMDALNSAYGSIAALTDDLIGGAQSGTVLAYDAAALLITTDIALDFSGGAKYIAVRRPDGTTNGLFIATPGAEPNQVALYTPLDFTPVLDDSMEPPYFGFGGADTWALKTIVRSIKPSGADDVQVACEEYLPAIYADDDNEPEE